jgi:predicted dehydrogenase
MAAMSARTVRWGIVGPGRIADKVMPDFAFVPGAEVVAVASRSQERADAFAKKHGLARAHGSYAAIVADPGVDVLYLTTPHRQHRDVAVAALRAGKALLVEKSFATTVAGAEAIIDTARETGRFVMEAMWTRFQPLVVEARRLLADGAIGEVRGVQADLGVDRPYDPADRLFDLAQGGGAMLDLGVYLVSFAEMILGAATKVVAQGSRTPSGVDAEAGILLEHGQGRRSVLLATLLNATPGQARIFGSKGYLDILPRFHHPDSMIVNRHGQPPETVTLRPLGQGFAHELLEVTEAIREGRTESAIMPLADTLAVQRTLNAACEQLGVIHSEES